MAAAVVTLKAAAVVRRAAGRKPDLDLRRLERIEVAVEIVETAGAHPEPIAAAIARPATTAARGKRRPLRSKLDRCPTRAHRECSVGPTREFSHAPMRAASLHRRRLSRRARVAQFAAMA
jgi:hypothetical protein